MKKIGLDKEKLILFFTAILATLGLPFILKSGNDGLSFTNSILSLVYFMFILGLYRRISRVHYSRRKVICTVIPAVFFSMFMVLGVNLYRYNNIYITSLKTWIKIILNIPLFYGTLSIIMDYFPRLNQQLIVKEGNSRLIKKIRQLMDAPSFWCWAGVLIFIAWCPILCATYPANYVYDAGGQLQPFIERGIIDLHHPLAHTELLIFFVLFLGKRVLGNVQIGMLMYTIFQMAIFAFALARAIRFMCRRRVANIFIMMSLFFFMFSPIISLLAISPTKNIIYTALFLLLILSSLDLYQRKWDYKSLINFVVIGFLNIIFENQGIYVFIFAMIVALLFDRRHWKKCLIGLATIVVMYSIYSVPVTKNLNGQLNYKDRTVEKLSVPIMQLANTAADSNSKISNNEKKEIKSFVPNYELYNQGQQACSDNYKWNFNVNKYIHNKASFWKLWLHVFLNNFNNYLDAWAKLTQLYWYPDINLSDWRSQKSYIDYANTYPLPEGWYQIKVKALPGFEWLSHDLAAFALKLPLQKVPIIAPVLSMGFAIWMLITTTFWTIYTGEKKYSLLLGLFWGLLGTLLLGPVAISRYGLPFLVSVPLLLTIMIIPIKQFDGN